jgi:hypothetical protein
MGQSPLRLLAWWFGGAESEGHISQALKGLAACGDVGRRLGLHPPHPLDPTSKFFIVAPSPKLKQMAEAVRKAIKTQSSNTQNLIKKSNYNVIFFKAFLLESILVPCGYS